MKFHPSSDDWNDHSCSGCSLSDSLIEFLISNGQDKELLKLFSIDLCI